MKPETWKFAPWNLRVHLTPSLHYQIYLLRRGYFSLAIFLQPGQFEFWRLLTVFSRATVVSVLSTSVWR